MQGTSATIILYGLVLAELPSGAMSLHHLAVMTHVVIPILSPYACWPSLYFKIQIACINLTASRALVAVSGILSQTSSSLEMASLAISQTSGGSPHLAAYEAVAIPVAR